MKVVRNLLKGLVVSVGICAMGSNLAGLIGTAYSRVLIAEQQRFVLPLAERREIHAGQFLRVPLPVKPPGILLEVHVTLLPDSFEEGVLWR